jgi:hypothetical protein
MNFKLNSKHVALSACTVVLMTACGGGDDDPAPAPPVTSAVPAEAQTSSASATTYVAALSVVDAGTSDTLEPIATLPDSLASDDTAEPAAVN